MTIVEGQIESLRRLKEILHENGITRFSSIGEINSFLKNYKSERYKVHQSIENTFETELKELKTDLTNYQKNYEDIKNDVTNKIDIKLKKIKEKNDRFKEKSNNKFRKIIYFPLLIILKLRRNSLDKNYEKIIQRKTQAEKQKVDKTEKTIDDYTKNRDEIITERCQPGYDELAFTKKIIQEQNLLIAGAVGENQVVNELKKLDDKYVLFNDFSREFNPPIFNRKENDRIYSIQIDHLLVANSGIFILETKNWSKKSINNLDLRSPVEQIMRTSFALFVLLNSGSGFNKRLLKKHHWGKKQIPIRNIIVMIKEKPKESFKYVKVKTLDDLKSYITYFDPIFNDEEVKNISDYLRMIMN